MLTIKNLSKRYEDNELALDNINLEVKQGEIFVLLGANGAGKSTTINLICGFIPPSSGQIFINEIDALSNPYESRKYLAYVSENVMLYDYFTGYQNISFFAKLSNVEKTKNELENLLRDIGLQEEFIHKPVYTYSKGMRQKTGIAIASVKNASLILLDEPFSGLDPKAAYDFQKLLIEMKNQGKCIFISMHDIFRTKELADNVGIMLKGRLVMTRTSKELEFEDIEKLYLDYMEGNYNQTIAAV